MRLPLVLTQDLSNVTDTESWKGRPVMVFIHGGGLLRGGGRPVHALQAAGPGRGGGRGPVQAGYSR